MISHLKSQRLCSRKEQRRAYKETVGKKANLVIGKTSRGRALDQSKITLNSTDLLNRLQNRITWTQDLENDVNISCLMLGKFV